jgi:uncharacterized protein YjaG (DUF416 family)
MVENNYMMWSVGWEKYIIINNCHNHDIEKIMELKYVGSLISYNNSINKS